MVYINDCSNDATDQLVRDYIKNYKLEDRISYQCNNKRVGHLHNQYHAITACADNEIIIILDGDDWLAHDEVLSYLHAIYKDPEVWLTYGQFKEFRTNRIGYCRRLISDELGGKRLPWVFGHLRSFYAQLFKLIKKEDLLYNGCFFPAAADVATMLPMVQMAGAHARFTDELLYIHNDLNPQSLQKYWPQQIFLRNIVQNRCAYLSLLYLK